MFQKNMDYFNEYTSKLIEEIDNLGKTEMNVLRHVNKSKAIFSQIQNIPEIKGYNEYFFSEIRENVSDLLLYMDILECEGCAAGTIGGIAVEGIVNVAIRNRHWVDAPLFDGMMSIFGINLMDRWRTNVVESSEATCTDAVEKEFVKEKDEVIRSCLYLQELYETAKEFIKVFSVVYDAYQNQLDSLNVIVNVSGKKDWDDFLPEEKTTTENVALLVDLLYSMGELEWIYKDTSDYDKGQKQSDILNDIIRVLGVKGWILPDKKAITNSVKLQPYLLEVMGKLERVRKSSNDYDGVLKQFNILNDAVDKLRTWKKDKEREIDDIACRMETYDSRHRNPLVFYLLRDMSELEIVCKTAGDYDTYWELFNITDDIINGIKSIGDFSKFLKRVKRSFDKAWTKNLLFPICNLEASLDPSGDVDAYQEQLDDLYDNMIWLWKKQQIKYPKEKEIIENNIKLLVDILESLQKKEPVSVFKDEFPINKVNRKGITRTVCEAKKILLERGVSERAYTCLDWFTETKSSNLDWGKVKELLQFTVTEEEYRTDICPLEVQINENSIQVIAYDRSTAIHIKEKYQDQINKAIFENIKRTIDVSYGYLDVYIRV